MDDEDREWARYRVPGWVRGRDEKLEKAAAEQLLSLQWAALERYCAQREAEAGLRPSAP